MIELYPESSGSAHRGFSRAKQCLARLLLSLPLVAGSVPAVAQTAPAASNASAVEVFRDQASRLGVRQCANLFAGLGNGLTAGSTYKVQTEAGTASPDAHSVLGLVGMAYASPNYKGQAAGVVFASPTSQGCEGNLVRVAPYQSSCEDVARILPAGSTSSGALSGVPLYNLGGNQGVALLVASGSSCVVVTVARSASS